MDDLHAQLNALNGERVLVIFTDGERNGTVSRVTPSTELPPETIPIRLRVAIDWSRFTVRFDDGMVLENIRGNSIHFPSLPTVRL